MNQPQNNGQKPHAGKTSNINNRPVKEIVVILNAQPPREVVAQGTEWQVGIDGTLHIKHGAANVQSFNARVWVSVEFVGA